MKNLNKLVAQWEAEIHEHLKDYNDNVEGDFSLEEFAEQHSLPIQRAYIFIMNLENDDIMQEIAEGNYSNFDYLDRNQFNDGYEDLMHEFMQHAMIMEYDAEQEDEDDGSEEIHTDHGAPLPLYDMETSSEIGKPVLMYKKADGSWDRVKDPISGPVDYAVAVLQKEIIDLRNMGDSDKEWAQIKMRELETAMQILMNHESK